MNDTSEVECEFAFFDTHREGASLVQLERAIYDAVKTAPKGEQGGRLIESMVFTPEKCRALGLKANAIPPGRVWIGMLRDADADNRAATQTRKMIGAPAMRTDRDVLLDGINLLADLEQRQSGCTRQVALEKATRSELGRVAYDLLAIKVANGEARSADDVVIDTTVPAGADCESRRKAFNRKFDRRVAELMAGPEPLSRVDAEAFALRDKAIYEEYRSLATA